MINRQNRFFVALILALALIMLINLSAFSWKASDDSIAEPEELKALKAMHLIDDDIATLDLNENISRAQFVGNLYKIAGYYSDNYQNSHKFIDVNNSTPYVKEIICFYEKGLINGTSENTFSPYADITYEQAFKIIIGVLGYDEYAKRLYGEGGSAVLMMANRLDLGKNIKIKSYDEPVSVYNASLLLYNAGCCNVAQTTDYTVSGEKGISYKINEGKILFSVNNDIYYGEGVMTSNGIVSLKDEPKENVAEIGGRELRTDNKYSKLIGCSVKYFYRSNKSENETLIWAGCNKKNQIIEVKSDSLLTDNPDYTMVKVLYEKNNKVEKIKINDYADIIYNNVRTENHLIKPKMGTVRFVDNNNDNVFDVVIIEEIKNIFVDSVSLNGNFIADMYGNTLVLDDYKNVFIYKNGEEATLAEVENDCVVSCIESADKKYLYIYADNRKITDTVEKISDNDGEKIFEISGCEYKMAYSFQKLLKENKYDCKLPQLGEKCVFYLDRDGNIADIRSVDIEKMQYALLINAAKSEKCGSENNIDLKLLLKNGETVITQTADNLTIDEEKNKKGISLLEDERLVKKNAVVKQVVKIAFNKEGEVSKIDISAPVESKYGYDTTKFTKDYYTGGGHYYVHNCYILDRKYMLNADTVCFAKFENLDGDDAYGIIKHSEIKEDGGKIATIYDCNDSMTAGAAYFVIDVKKGEMKDKILLVDKVCTATYNGETCKKIYGYSAGEYVSYTTLHEDTIPADLKRGDVIRYIMWKDRISNVEVCCRLSENPESFVNNYGKNDCTIYGYIYSVGENSIVTVDNLSVEPKLTLSGFGNLPFNKIQIYDARHNKVFPGTRADLAQSSSPEKDGSLADNPYNKKVFIYQYIRNVKDMVVVYY